MRFAIGRDENIAGLEIPVNDVSLMREIHHIADFLKKPQPVLQAKASARDVIIQRKGEDAAARLLRIADVFHHEERPPVLC